MSCCKNIKIQLNKDGGVMTDYYDMVDNNGYYVFSDVLYSDLVNGVTYSVPCDSSNYTITSYPQSASFSNCGSLGFKALPTSGNKFVRYNIVTTSDENINIDASWGDHNKNQIHSSTFNSSLTYTYSVFDRELVISWKFNEVDLSKVERINFTSGCISNVDVMRFDRFVNLDLLYIRVNKLTSFNCVLPLSLTTLNLQQNQLISFSTYSIPDNITDINLRFNQLTTQNINDVLIRLDQLSTVGQASLNTQTPSAPPSGAGIIAKSNLENKGWFILTD